MTFRGNRPGGMASRVKTRLPSPRQMIVADRVVRDEDEESITEADIASKSQLEPVDAALNSRGEDTDSACEDDISEDESDGDGSSDNSLPKGLMLTLPPRIRNLIVRGASGFCLIAGFTLLVLNGPVGLFLLAYAVLTKSYAEVMNLGFRMCRIDDAKTKSLCWYLFFVTNFYLDGRFWLKLLYDGFQPLIGRSAYLDSLSSILNLLVKQHPAFTFAAYFSAIIWFVSSMKNGNYLARYAVVAWTHTSLFVLVIPVHMILVALLDGGMIFVVVPMIVITINDVAAYYVGFWFGKTPLIRLSPKKTMEGYIGGGFITIVLGTLFTALCLKFHPFLTCPVQTNPGYLTTIANRLFDVVPSSQVGSEVITLFTVEQCTRAVTFQPTTLTIWSTEWTVSPFVGHGFLISIFAAILGPFGGFFASGFKRACNKKNFGSLIPGHGGVVDRCDCMFLMAAFIYVYFDVLKKVGQLEPSEV